MLSVLHYCGPWDPYLFLDSASFHDAYARLYRAVGWPVHSSNKGAHNNRAEMQINVFHHAREQIDHHTDSLFAYLGTSSLPCKTDIRRRIFQPTDDLSAGSRLL